MAPEPPFPEAVTALSEFSTFPKLPIEIRQTIWRHTLPGPRVVRVSYNADRKECRSSSPFPLALQVSQESRNEALRFYQLSFGPKSTSHETMEGGSTVEMSGKIYFNFEIDVFFVLTQEGFSVEGEDDDSNSSNNDEIDNNEDVATNSIFEISKGCEDFLDMILHTADTEKIRKLAGRIDIMIFVGMVAKHGLFEKAVPLSKFFSAGCEGFMVLKLAPEDFTANGKNYLQVIYRPQKEGEACDSAENKENVTHYEDMIQTFFQVSRFIMTHVKITSEATGINWSLACLYIDDKEAQLLSGSISAVNEGRSA